MILYKSKKKGWKWWALYKGKSQTMWQWHISLPSKWKWRKYWFVFITTPLFGFSKNNGCWEFQLRFLYWYVSIYRNF